MASHVHVLLAIPHTRRCITLRCICKFCYSRVVFVTGEWAACISYSPFRTIEQSGGMYKDNSALTFHLDRGIRYPYFPEFCCFLRSRYWPSAHPLIVCIIIIIIIIGFLINVQIQGQYPQQWAPFQVTGLLHAWQISHQISRCLYHQGR